MKRGKLFWGFALGLVVIVIVLTGGVALSQEKPINDFESIAGTWKGTFETNSGETRLVTLTIRPDGTYTSKRPKGSSNGTLELLENGTAVTNRGTVYTLLERGEKRFMSVSNRRGSGELAEVK